MEDDDLADKSERWDKLRDIEDDRHAERYEEVA